MYPKIALVSLMLVGLAAPSLAADAPAFLNDKFASDPEACKKDANMEELDALTIDKSGIFGFEFGCTFLEFWNEQQDGKTKSTIALASCGDDSGIIRPDMITMILEGEGELRVQSQNEYAITEAIASLSQGAGENAGEDFQPYEYVTATYTKCK